MEGLLSKVEYRPGCLVWNAEGKTLDVLRDGVSTSVPYTHLILATGATDRVLPFPGWLTPGVYTLGGSQVALKHQGCAIGERVAFMGTGPLLYLVAYQYAKAGAKVAAVLDTSRFGDRAAALPGMLRAPRRAFAQRRAPGRRSRQGARDGAGLPAWRPNPFRGLRRRRLRPGPAFGNPARQPGRLRIRIQRARPQLDATTRCRRAQQRARRVRGGRRRGDRRRRCGRTGGRAGGAGAA
ncbi:Hydrogen cyanide synthase subunit HcnB [compost metagenome]